MSLGGWVMTSKTSLSNGLFNKGLFSSDLKRLWWVSALYSIALLFILPFYHLLQGTSKENEWAWEGLKESLKLSFDHSEFQVMLIYAIPVLVAVLLFSYLHSNRSTATMHSFPVTRKQLFCTHWGAGVVLLTVPVIITGLVLMLVQQATFLQEAYTLGNIFSWMGLTLLFDILFFALAVFVGMYTGNPAAQIIFTYILLALPFGLYELVRYNLSIFLYGFSNAPLHQSLIDSLPPYALLSGHIGKEAFSTGNFIEYLILILVIFAFALVAYKARKLEAAGDVVAFSIVRPIFKYGVTLCTMLLVGAYFASISDGSLAIAAFGYFFGSLLGYVIAEILLQKSFMIIRTGYKGYLVYAILLAVALFAVQTDAFGYVNRVPQPEEIEEVFLGSINYWSDINETKSGEANKEITDSIYQPQGVFFKTPQNIKNVTDLHHKILQIKPPLEGPQQFIIYSLANGKHLIRQYNLDEKKLAANLKPVYESVEYKEGKYPVLRQNPNAVKIIEIRDPRTPKEPAILADKVVISQLMGALRKDLMNATYEQMISQKQNLPTIDITDTNDKIQSYGIPNSYTSVSDWLKQNNYFKKNILQLNEIKNAVLEAPNSDPDVTPKRVEIRDPVLINELLNISGYPGYSQDEIISVSFYVQSNYGGFQFQEYISKDTPVSQELRKYLQKLKKP